MDFLGGALPNVMFIVGMLAIGLGLGIELKLVPLNKEIDKTGRVGAIIVGLVLVAASLIIYLNPSLANRTQSAGTATSAANAQAIAPLATSAPAVSAATAAPPTDTPPAAPATPAATAAPPMQTAVPSVSVPDLRDMDEKAAKRALESAGLRASKAEQCQSSSQPDPKAKKGHIQCQSPAPDESVALGTTVEYVLAGK